MNKIWAFLLQQKLTSEKANNMVPDGDEILENKPNHIFLFYSLKRVTSLRANSASLRPGNTALFEEMSQQWQAVYTTAFDLTSPRFEPRIFRSKNEQVTTRPTGLEKQTFFKLMDAFNQN